MASGIHPPFTDVYTSTQYTNGQVPAVAGETAEINGKRYQFVQFLDAVTYVAGHVCTWGNATATAVTNDRSGGTDIGGNRFSGICLAVPVQNGYGWVLFEGYYAAVITNGDDDITAGLPLIVATATDGACDSFAEGISATPTEAEIVADDAKAYRFIGFSLAADVDAANTVAAIISRR